MSIDINSLTIGDAKMIADIFGNMNNHHTSNITQSMIGKYVIIRSRNEGINCGVVEVADETGVVLTDARRIWYHRPEDKKLSWYEGVAISGLASSSKVSPAVTRKAIIEDYSIIECNAVAEKSLREFASHEQQS